MDARYGQIIGGIRRGRAAGVLALSTFGVNKPIMAVDATGQRFKIYVKEAFPPVYLIEYTQ